jgi:hypothetical protein
VSKAGYLSFTLKTPDAGDIISAMPAQKPDLVGFYHRNRIWIYRDEFHQKPWRVVFDGLSSPEIREPSEAGAKNTALALAQNTYFPDLRPILEKIEWRNLRR